MRRLHKYQIYKKINPITKFPLRIFKFKRPKWTRSFSFWKKKIKFNFFRNLYYKDRSKEVSLEKIVYKQPYLSKKKICKSFYYPRLQTYTYLNVNNCLRYRKLYYKKFFKRYVCKRYVYALKHLLTKQRFSKKMKRIKRKRLSMFKFNFFPAKYAKRIFRAKRKSKYKNRQYKSYHSKHFIRFPDITSLSVRMRFWNKVKFCYKNRLKAYSFLLGLFDNSANSKYLKQNSNIANRKDLYNKFYFEHYFNPYTLVWLTSFLSSSFEARNKSSAKNLLVNNKIVSSKMLLKKGDLVSVLDKTINVLKVLRRFNRSFSYCSHTEIDYYTQNIIITKNMSALSKDDYLLLIRDYVNSHKIK